MAIVPPGNKQIGDYTNIVVTYKPWPVISSYLVAGFVVTYKPCPVISSYLVAGFVVSRNMAPPVFSNLLTASFVVTKDTAITTPTVVPVKNKFIVETLIMNLKYNTPGELTFT